MDKQNFENTCNCECCHCKKIFMLTVLLILSFIAGIMVGNCTTMRSPDIYRPRHHYITYPTQAAIHKISKKSPKFTQNAKSEKAPDFPNTETGGFIIEIEPEE